MLEVVNGTTQLTLEDLGDLDEFFTDEEKSKIEEVLPQAKPLAGFWYRALSHIPPVNDFIKKTDEECLNHITNIEVELCPDNDNFSLIFHFSENDWFTNPILVVKLIIDKHDDCSIIEGTEIDWKEGKNLCVHTVVKSQKNKKSGKMRTITKEKPKASFFHVFQPRSIQEEEDEEDDMPEVLMEYDIEGISDSLRYIRDFIWKYGAASYFGVKIPDYDETGIFFNYQDLDNFVEEDDEYEDVNEDSEDDDDDNEDNTKKIKKDAKTAKKTAKDSSKEGKEAGPENAECKQQ